MQQMRRFIGLAGLAAVLALLAAPTVATAAHSDYGCHNCHVPHQASTPDDPNASWGVPLWSPAQTSDGLPTFTLYNSPSFDASDTITQPDGASKLCLGCHDGSYIAFQFMPESNAIFGPEDLARSHPVSFKYDTSLASKDTGLHDPVSTQSGLGGSIEEDLLDKESKLQCTSCHDIHTSGKGEYLLRYDYDVETHTDNVLCRVCHDK
jgi:predicted CXXCH cytochrome family protein